VRPIAFIPIVCVRKRLRRSCLTLAKKFRQTFADSFESTMRRQVYLARRIWRRRLVPGLEAEIARSIDGGHGMRSMDAVHDALRRRGEGYAREQKCRLVADRHPDATIASESVKKAFDAGALVAAAMVLAGQSVPKMSSVRLTENLLAQPSGGGGL
jgi:hypothetical protein